MSDHKQEETARWFVPEARQRQQHFLFLPEGDRSRPMNFSSPRYHDKVSHLEKMEMVDQLEKEVDRLFAANVALKRTVRVLNKDISDVKERNSKEKSLLEARINELSEQLVLYKIQADSRAEDFDQERLAREELKNEFENYKERMAMRPYHDYNGN